MVVGQQVEAQMHVSLQEGVKTENDHINLKVAGQDGSVVQFKIKRHTPLSKLMKAYCERQVWGGACVCAHVRPGWPGFPGRCSCLVLLESEQWVLTDSIPPPPCLWRHCPGSLLQTHLISSVQFSRSVVSDSL